MNEEKFYNRFGEEIEDTFEAHHPECFEHKHTPMLSGPYAVQVMFGFLGIAFLLISGVIFLLEAIFARAF